MRYAEGMGVVILDFQRLNPFVANLIVTKD